MAMQLAPLRKAFKPEVKLQLEPWKNQYTQRLDRYRFLVLRGASRTGNLVGPLCFLSWFCPARTIHARPCPARSTCPLHRPRQVGPTQSARPAPNCACRARPTQPDNQGLSVNFNCPTIEKLLVGFLKITELVFP